MGIASPKAMKKYKNRLRGERLRDSTNAAVVEKITTMMVAPVS
jgi:hypothetical protein